MLYKSSSHKTLAMGAFADFVNDGAFGALFPLPPFPEGVLLPFLLPLALPPLGASGLFMPFPVVPEGALLVRFSD